MAKLNPNAGVRTGIRGLVTQVTQDEKDKKGRRQVKFYLADVTILEGEFEQEAEKFTVVVPIEAIRKSEGYLAKSLAAVTSNTDPSVLEGKVVEFGYKHESFVGRDGEQVDLDYPIVKAVGDSEPDVPPLTKEEILVKLVGLTPAEGVKLAREPGIRKSEYAEILKVKNRVVLEFGLEIAEGRYTVP